MTIGNKFLETKKELFKLIENQDNEFKIKWQKYIDDLDHKKKSNNFSSPKTSIK